MWNYAGPIIFDCASESHDVSLTYTSGVHLCINESVTDLTQDFLAEFDLKQADFNNASQLMIEDIKKQLDYCIDRMAADTVVAIEHIEGLQEPNSREMELEILEQKVDLNRLVQWKPIQDTMYREHLERFLPVKVDLCLPTGKCCVGVKFVGDCYKPRYKRHLFFLPPIGGIKRGFSGSRVQLPTLSHRYLLGMIRAGDEDFTGVAVLHQDNVECLRRYETALGLRGLQFCNCYDSDITELCCVPHDSTQLVEHDPNTFRLVGESVGP